ncbi:MAG: hypothetical protein CM15mP105_2500 [Methanobacteriota archaeon]|nr:MAG: hypothetical protein CM15mP105_2500 [Euryarchaeota archaeon]
MRNWNILAEEITNWISDYALENDIRHWLLECQVEWILQSPPLSQHEQESAR